MADFKAKLRRFMERLRENSYENLIWVVNFFPQLGGFSIFYLSREFNVPFWIVHTSLTAYVYLVGTTAYMLYFVQDWIDIINSFSFNVYVFILITITTIWIFLKRKDLHEILNLVKESDELVYSTGRFAHKYQKLLRKTRIVIIMCYLFHFFNEVLIYIPSRTFKMDNFSTVSCYGMAPLTSSPNREICMAILAAQELIAIVVVGSYDAVLLFLFMHTTAIFLILKEDMMSFQDINESCDGSQEMRLVTRKYLRNLVYRHALALDTVKKLQGLYTASMGLGFALNALSLGLFFVLPPDVLLKLASAIAYCLFIFFLYCIQGQSLTTASEKFEMAVYCCGWENLDVRERNSILFMLYVAQKPVVVSVAGVIPIRIYTFASTMQTIYKFVTVFRV